MTHSPPLPAAELAALSREDAAAAFDPRDASPEWLSDNARLAILFPPGLVVNASAAMLALFGVDGRGALEARLLRGEGPSARRLRRLAATLPIGEPRLEPIRVIANRRQTGVNMRCVRVCAPEGGSWLLASVPALGAAAQHPGATPAANSRFLWTLDEEGRFGAPDPVLAATLGANAPRRGEPIEALLRRVGLDESELVRVLGERQTFSALTVEWPLSGASRRRLMALSAAPRFGRHREFLGYRGFGVLGDEIDAAAEASLAAGFVEEERPRLDEASEPGPAALAEAAEGLAQGNVGGAERIEPDREPAPAHRPGGAPPPEASPAADGVGSAPPPGAGEADLPPAAFAAQPDLAERALANEAHPATPERTAEIYVLRHPPPAASSNIVPIRPGALEALAREALPASHPESVELSRGERDAFREIARALVGRAPASGGDPTDQQGGADGAKEPRIEARAGPPAGLEGEPAARGGDGESQPNAGAVLDRLPVGVVVARDGRALYANRTLLDLAGYRDFAEFEAAQGLSRMFRDSDAPGVTTQDASAAAIVTAQGRVLPIEGYAQVVGWDGAPATLITLRRLVQAEPRLNVRAADDLQAMLDRATDGAVTLDSVGRILSLNEPAERLFGYRQNDVAGQSVLMLLAPPSHPETTARLERLNRGGEAEAAFRPLQVVGRDRRGASIPLALTLARVGSGDAPQFCALARDVSRERETERRLVAERDAAQAASAAKTDFLAQVSHEIRTPLHAILGFAEVMLEQRFGPVGNERYKDYLKDIHASADHVMSLADDLLDLSKIEAGKLDLAFAAVDANSVIRECVSLMQPQAARERVIMRVLLHDRLPRVMVDERSLKQIMLNLMSNAVKFNEPGGQVIVSTAVDPAGQAVIRVRDTGVGMSENEVGLALAPFGQVGKAGLKGGAGLGLPLTKALVEANKAEFSIKSRREQGTLIEIAFPNVQAAQ